MSYQHILIVDIIEKINRETYLPAIQREFVWTPSQIERLFDSIMSKFPIGTFLYWKLKEEKQNAWPIYDFIRDFDSEQPHNPPASLAGINKDITLVLDGQQRIASLYIGLCGSFRYFYYRPRHTRLYLNLLKQPQSNEDNPEELTYGFAFRENSEGGGDDPQFWYPVGDILNSDNAEDAKEKLEQELSGFTREQQRTAKTLVGTLHHRIHTERVANFYEEKSQNYEKVLQIFVRANSAGVQLGYSDLLLATATSQWKNLNAREEMHAFTESLNDTGTGYRFGQDFVLKACLYLTGNLPVPYKVKNFTKQNLGLIEDNWENIKWCLTTTVRLLSRFGFTAKNIVAPLALLPIALYILQRGDKSFDESTAQEAVAAQTAIRKWFVFSTLKGAFGGSSDTTLTRLRGLLHKHASNTAFPSDDLYKSLEILPQFNQDEIEQISGYKHGQRYTYLVLSLLYPDRYWGHDKFEEDHIFPKSQFNRARLRELGYDDEKVESYMKMYDTLPNLQLLTESENRSKHARPFDEWIANQDEQFVTQHTIPSLPKYGMDAFGDFMAERTALIKQKLEQL